ncbi:restriction endonuclease subunit S [Providencia sp. MGF014]|uniref:restriction endonuclease subunit S n=1 Tax=Providencia sp. MGF014 TaxID=2565573 RepID=UPI00109D1403|nr:restriction endonuclease subunit S [Providencia sp. MGF014]THB29755.1 restriction endonuclease subunit S [Providencia sp. MGF014]
MTVEKLITGHIDIWSSALQTRSTAGRGSSGKIDLYGIKKLRELILELAVRGKLVPQDPNDEPASELLKRIVAEKAELVKQGKIKKQKPLPEISEDEKPFELPEGWEWVRLGFITNYGECDKAEPTDTDADTWIVELEDIEKSTSRLLNRVKFSERPFKSSKNKFNKNDVLYGKLRPYLDKVLVADDSGVCSTEIIPIKVYGNILPSYLRLLLKSPRFIAYANESTHGMNLPRLGTDKAINAVVELTAIAEQVRIVNKVDELMSLCDQLEQQSLTSLDAHQQLVETLLATLTDSQNAKELAENWSRINQHFDTLFTTEASIDALKQTILQLAVMGKLTEQEKACTLECKTSLIDGLSIYDDIDKRIPKTWSLSKLDNISSAIIDCPHSTPKWADKGFICVRTNQIKPGYLELNDSRYVSEQTYIERIQRLEPSFNDILYSREGGVLGVACRIPEDVKVCLGQRMMLIRSGDKVLSEYLEIVLNSPLITILARQMTTGGAAPRINVSTVKNYLIPLPPKEEQYQIIARVKELLNLGDTLKSHLQSAQQTQLHLADALTDAALN